MEDNKLKFVVRGRKEGDKFVLEGITNYILQKLDSFDDKTIIVTLEILVPTNTIKRTFTFDRKTDIGLIQVGDRYHACVSGDDLRPPEGSECEKRVIKQFDKPNSLPAR